MITKAKLKSHIEKFPEKMSIEELIERLIFVEKLEARINDSKSGKSISEDEFKLEVSKWLK